MSKRVNIHFDNREPDEKIRLHNRDLILVEMEHRNGKASHKLERVFMVASYTSLDKDEKLSKYCVFINLDDGSKAFAEPSSRYTSRRRIISHLRDSSIHQSHQYQDPTFRIIPADSYTIDVNVTD